MQRLVYYYIQEWEDLFACLTCGWEVIAKVGDWGIEKRKGISDEEEHEEKESK